MRTVIVKVDISDDRELIVMTRKGEGYISIMENYTEIQLPTDDIEIDNIAEKKYPTKMGYCQEYNDGKHQGFIEGIEYLRDQILNPDKP